VKGEKIKPYASVAGLLAAMREAEQKGQVVNAGYVFDRPTGLKLFAHRAFYVAGGAGKAVAASLAAFAWKEEAEQFAAKHGGKVLPLDDAKKLAAAAK
jgi:NitT/TauT family transport system substrate-binding protein